MRDDQKSEKAITPAPPITATPNAVILDRRKAPRMEEPSSDQLIYLETYTRGNQLIDRLTIAMEQFEAATKAQHASDPASFPLMRTEDNWWNEFRAWVAYDYAVTVMGVDPVSES